MFNQQSTALQQHMGQRIIEPFHFRYVPSKEPFTLQKEALFSIKRSLYSIQRALFSIKNALHYISGTFYDCVGASQHDCVGASQPKKMHLEDGALWIPLGADWLARAAMSTLSLNCMKP